MKSTGYAGLTRTSCRGTMAAMSESQILKRGMQPTHELMAEWILQNPGGTLREMGAYFGYSVPWLSQVVNSDMFKAHMAERLKDVKAYVNLSIPEKMGHLADLAIERVTEVLNKTEDPEIIKDTFDKVMHRYGYAPNARNAVQPDGPKPQAGQVNNVFFLDRKDFAAVQEKMIRSHDARPALENQADNPPEENVKLPAPDTEKV